MAIDLSLQQVLLRLLALLIITAVHGFALAAAAVLLRDPGPRHDGRLSLNPFVHLDVLGLATGILTRMGWIRPMAIDPANLRWGRLGLALCALLSLCALVLLAAVAAALRPWAAGLRDPMLASYALLELTVLVQTVSWFVAVNLLPLPPLTGGYLLAAAAPGLARKAQAHVGLLSILLAGGLIVFGRGWFLPLGGRLAEMLLR